MKRDPNCTRCVLHESAHFNRCVFGAGPKPCALMFVGEAPGANEDRHGIAFCGQAGDLLDHVIDKLGILRSLIYITNILKCRPPDNILPKGKTKLLELTQACYPFLKHEIRYVKPKVIVALGGTPLLALTGKAKITKWEGMTLEVEGLPPIIPAFHPAGILHKPSNEANLARALYKAAKMAGLKVATKAGGIYNYE